MQLNPHYTPATLRQLGLALYQQERFAEAAEILERAQRRRPDYPFTYRTLASVYGHLGKLEDAKAAWKNSMSCSNPG